MSVLPNELQFMVFVLVTLVASVVGAEECCVEAPQGHRGVVAYETHNIGLLEPTMVWSPEVEELKWSDIQPRFVDKPWLTSESNLDSNDVVVKGVVDSPNSAISRAIEEQLLPRLVKALRLNSAWQERVAIRRIRRELERSPIITDRFQQTFYKVLGDEQHEVFTREAILLDVSPSNLQKLIRPVRRDLHRGSQVRSGAFSFAAILIGVASFVCWGGSRFFNRVTQGYYVWPIRLTATAVMLGTLSVAAGITFSILQTL